ncbi:hypothetical protein F0562_031820 [Nyssa sinensis]|uniref:U3 small nucleolar RNA-associated protein 18 homolog n=1 Tax=Nyssa sinensis TaxID=561372 RepID=A0A5J5ATK7_9ASTE|nr:hypothetical protein F0562_031820 [Nyssa sinensis]
MGNLGYEVSAYLYAASKNSSWQRFWKNNAKWIGYVAVSNDETSKRLGYRDFTIAWKGTKTMSKWIIDFKNILKPILVEHDPTIKAESGFLHLYTDKDESCEDRKYSTREQILNAVKRLIQLYQNEELSISITGHSLGSALAILSAYDIALERAHNMMNDSRVIPICVFSYSSPRVGNNKLKERLESLGVKVLRIVNVNDIVPKLPRVVFNENQPKMLMKLTESLSWNYWHVGVKLTIGQKIKSFDLMIKSGDLISAHKLENLLDLLKGGAILFPIRLNPSMNDKNLKIKNVFQNFSSQLRQGMKKSSVFLRMMGLISQNVLPKDQVKEFKRKADEPLLLGGNEEIEGRKQPDSYTLKEKKRKEEQKQLEIEQEREMKKLENFLFGSLYSPAEFGKDDEEELIDGVEKGSALFFIDRSANSILSVYEEDAEPPEQNNNEEETKQRKPVWADEEEEKTNINIAKINRLRKLRKEEEETLISGSVYVSRLGAQHIKLNPGTEWAQLDSRVKNYNSDNEDSDEENGAELARGYRDVDGVDDILRTNENLVWKNSTKLLPGLLEYSRLVDANAEDPSTGPINSVQFHRNAQLLLAGGLDKKLRFFQIDGKRNTKIQSIFLDDCPIRKASFLPDGSQVIISGRRKFFYSFDLVKAKVDKIGPLTGREEKSLEVFEVSPDSSTIAFVGNEGYILLVSSKTKELIGTLKMNGTARTLAFANDGQKLLSSGGDGHIYHWDLRTRACFHKAVDEGCINGTALCTSPIGTLFAAGSDSGIVNIYNREEFLVGKRKPIKTIENLTTKVDFMKFNNDAQILAISSSMKKSSLKLVHIPSFTVFSNWPPPNQNLHYPCCLDFSPGGGFVAMANAAGKALKGYGDVDIFTANFRPLKATLSRLSDQVFMKLVLQPNYGFQRGLTNEQLSTLEAEMETFRAGVVSSTSKFSGNNPQNEVDGIHVDDNMNAEPSFDTHSKTTPTCTKKDPEVIRQELRTIYSKNALEPLEVCDMGKSFELMESDPVGSPVSKQLNELCFDLESPWIGA